MRIILGSKSVSRRLLLGKIVDQFGTLSPDIDEQAIRSTDFSRLPLLLAHAKADALAPIAPADSVLITSDQVVVCAGELREKPASEAQARQWLRDYARYPAQTNTAVVIHNLSNDKRVEGLDIARVHYGVIPEAAIDQLIAEGGIFHAAGGFLLESPLLEPYLIRVEGEPESVMGLPIALTVRLLIRAGAKGPVLPDARRRYGTIGP